LVCFLTDFLKTRKVKGFSLKKESNPAWSERHCFRMDVAKPKVPATHGCAVPVKSDRFLTGVVKPLPVLHPLMTQSADIS
jgi:hypothetical protein